ncbi:MULTISPECIES: arginine repressor [Streptococcus]|uniref:Arginine repressor n=1 Tax=Streptococcus ruminantium TaxID=1917441 RepID=A0A2Z5TXH4_9STRE|nr:MULTISPECIES: arginine repressor [Streptococcus]MDQ8759531.1 arginine repressor [Streptococcus ruminantium]MDQ8766898.1 arginine repressor [Streptococcus ruminantium]MDQ8768460.1 arginine repressor [Streptococcus ruminantium]MDQ8774334.1 arginine repressor [Streptococcus ruminantium]MDQ8779468.1 arginine repressor [Streptococcus ruminantium]
MNKRERLEIIKDLVVRFPIDRQEEIVERLEAMGVTATQATVSRDIKELGIIKIPSADKGYIYGLPKTGRVKAKTQNVLDVSVMDKMIHLRLVPGSSAVVKRQIWEQFQTHIFSIIADDDSILLIVAEEQIVPQIERTVRRW